MVKFTQFITINYKFTKSNGLKRAQNLDKSWINKKKGKLRAQILLEPRKFYTTTGSHSSDILNLCIYKWVITQFNLWRPLGLFRT